MNPRLDLEFIHRCHEMYIEQTGFNEKARKANYRRKNEKTKELRKKLSADRYKNIRQQILSLSLEEVLAIKKFYANTPDGYVVDHIMPISKGGKHHVDNFQYLTIEENMRKGAKLNWDRYAPFDASNKTPKKSEEKYLQYLQKQEDKLRIEKSYKERLDAKLECVFLRPFNKMMLCPECLKSFSVISKICDECPNEKTREANAIQDRHLKRIGIYRPNKV